MISDLKSERTKMMIEIEKLKEDKFNIQSNLDTARDEAREAKRAQHKVEITIEEVTSAAELAEQRSDDNARRLLEKIDNLEMTVETYASEQKKDKIYISELEKKLGERELREDEVAN